MKTIDFIVGGNTYKLPKIIDHPEIINDYLKWCEPQIPNPYNTMMAAWDELKKLPPDLQRFAIENAAKASRTKFNFDSPEIQAIFSTISGIQKFVAVILQKHQPSLTDAQCWSVYMQGVEEHGADQVAKVFAEMHPI